MYEEIPNDPLAAIHVPPTPDLELDDEGPIIPDEFRQGHVTLPHPTEPTSIRLSRLHEKARALSPTPGVYLMKDTRGVVIYVGKSRSLRDRVGSYFLPSTDLGPTKGLLLDYVADFDTLPCDTEVQALLVESRLIKDIQPRFNAALTDDKTYPYLEITTYDDYPAVYVTRTPAKTGARLYGPFISSSALREAVTLLQRAFKFRTCRLEIAEADPKKRFFRPCLLYAINQCTAPCADKISRDSYRDSIERLKRFLDSKGGGGGDVLRDMTTEMEQAAQAREYEKAAALRDQIKALRSLSDRGHDDGSLQPEVFYQDHQAGLHQLQALLELPEPPRSLECIDIAHLQGEATVGSLVCFIDGRPFKNGYRRFRIKTVQGINDYASIQEVITRRYRDAGNNAELYPDIILIDGGLGQLHAALEAFNTLNLKPPMVLSLAKREEEIYIQARQAPLKLSRTNAALKLLQHIRDEAHRFGQAYHHMLIRKRRFEDEIANGRGMPPLKKRPRKKKIVQKINPAIPQSEISASDRPDPDAQLNILTPEDLARFKQLGAQGYDPDLPG